MVTDKQRNVLLKNGYTDKDINDMSASKISEVIGSILDKRPENQAPYGKTVYTPKVESADKFQKAKFDTSSYYVAYAKDLCIAMLNAHVEARKINQEIEPLEIGKIMHTAVEAIKEARQEFE